MKKFCSTSITLALCLMGTTAFAANTQVTLVVNEWTGYLSMHSKAIKDHCSKKGMDIDILVGGPDISDEENLFNSLRAGVSVKGKDGKLPVDIATPTESFLKSREGKILKLLAPVDTSKIEGYDKLIPAELRNSVSHIQDGKHYGVVFMAGYYGMYYNSAKVKKAPTSWDFLWSDAAKGKYSVSKDTYFVNGHIAQWAIDASAKNVKNAYDIDKMDRDKLGQKLEALAQNAKHLWVGIGNSPEQIKDLEYTVSWGFDLGPEWKLALPAPGSSTWVDVLTLTNEAAKDANKLKAFECVSEFAITPKAQEIFKEKLRAVPISKDGGLSAAEVKKYFNSDFFWKPLEDRTGNALKGLWDRAVATRK